MSTPSPVSIDPLHAFAGAFTGPCAGYFAHPCNDKLLSLHGCAK